MQRFHFASSVVVLCAVATLSWCGLSVRADDPAKMAEPSTQPAGMPDQAAMMAAWQKYATPGKEHAEMAKAVGTWDAAMEDMTMGGAKSTATAKISMVMDGRYMMEEVSGTTMGMPFTGMMLMGFDNQTKEYTSTWVDNMGTGVAISHGKMDAKGALELKGTMVDPMSGKEMATREVITHQSADQSTMEMFMPGPNGTEAMAFRMVYTRRK